MLSEASTAPECETTFSRTHSNPYTSSFTGLEYWVCVLLQPLLPGLASLCLSCNQNQTLHILCYLYLDMLHTGTRKGNEAFIKMVNYSYEMTTIKNIHVSHPLMQHLCKYLTNQSHSSNLKWLLMRRGFWCQRSYSEYFRICRFTGIFMHHHL